MLIKSVLLCLLAFLISYASSACEESKSEDYADYGSQDDLVTQLSRLQLFSPQSDFFKRARISGPSDLMSIHQAISSNDWGSFETMLAITPNLNRTLQIQFPDSSEVFQISLAAIATNCIASDYLKTLLAIGVDPRIGDISAFACAVHLNRVSFVQLLLDATASDINSVLSQSVKDLLRL